MEGKHLKLRKAVLHAYNMHFFVLKYVIVTSIAQKSNIVAQVLLVVKTIDHV